MRGKGILVPGGGISAPSTSFAQPSLDPVMAHFGTIHCAKNVPTISRHGKGWRAQIRRLGHTPQSKTFPLKSQAWEWATRAEREILAGTFAPAKHTLGEAFEKYAAEVSPKKRGGRWEQYRLLADPIRKAPMASRAIGALTAADISQWRDRRLTSVSGATVRREMNLIESVFEIARREWKWIGINPTRDVAKPANPKSRRRRVPDADTKAVTERLTGPSGSEVAAGFLLGIETGMRAGEIWSLERPQIDLKTGVARLLKTKNGDERDVALSPKAVQIMRGLLSDGRQSLMLTTTAVRDTLFRKARVAAGIEDLHFHDSRTEAIYRLSKKFDVLELAQQVGHRDIRSLRFYYKADASDLAKRLASPAQKPKPRRPTSAGRQRRQRA